MDPPHDAPRNPKPRARGLWCRGEGGMNDHEWSLSKNQCSLMHSPPRGPVRPTADAPPADACYFRNLLASKASLRLSINQAVRAIRAARIEIAFPLPCCFSSRAT